MKGCCDIILVLNDISAALEYLIERLTRPRKLFPLCKAMGSTFLRSNYNRQFLRPRSSRVLHAWNIDSVTSLLVCGNFRFCLTTTFYEDTNMIYCPYSIILSIVATIKVKEFLISKGSPQYGFLSEVCSHLSCKLFPLKLFIIRKQWFV